MLAQIPRKPVFPQHLINKVKIKIQRQVDQDVIPVSTGIYSQTKLIQRLQAIPKPLIVDYQDPVFYELANVKSKPLRVDKCGLCGSEYNNKLHKPVQCKFCGIWNCAECICHRSRYHPRAKEVTSQRYEICHCCDDKFLSLTLNHGYYEARCLMEELIRRVRGQKQDIESEVLKLQEDESVTKEFIKNNKIKIAVLNKEKVDAQKGIQKLKEEKEEMLFRVQYRQKYLTQLVDKKQKIEEERRKRDEEARSKQQRKVETKEAEVDVSVGDESLIQVERPIRTLSHNNVFSEAIYRDSAKLLDQSSPPTLPDLPQTISQTAYHYPEPDPSQKLQNFFNYHEWSKQNQEQISDGEINRNYEGNINKEVEDEPVIDSKVIQPPNNPFENENQETLRQKKLAQIFTRPVPKRYEKEEQAFQNDSLDEEAVNQEKKQIVKAAIQEYRKQRLQYMPQNEPGPQKCSCSIY